MPENSSKNCKGSLTLNYCGEKKDYRKYFVIKGYSDKFLRLVSTRASGKIIGIKFIETHTHLMDHRLLYLLFAALAGLSGCASVKTFVDTPEEGGISETTYAFVPLSGGELDQASAVLYNEISRRIGEKLRQRGYTVDTENPQLLIAFNILTEEQRKEITRSNNPYGNYNHMWTNTYGGGWWPPMDRSRYKEIWIEKTGTLVIDVVAAAEKKLRWRGLGTGPVNDPEERFETTYKIVDKLFKRFPAATASSGAR